MSGPLSGPVLCGVGTHGYSGMEHVPTLQKCGMFASLLGNCDLLDVIGSRDNRIYHTYYQHFAVDTLVISARHDPSIVGPSSSGVYSTYIFSSTYESPIIGSRTLTAYIV